MYSFLKKIEFPTALKYLISEKNPQRAWWQHHQTKLPMARMPAIILYIYISSLDSICNLYAPALYHQSEGGGSTCPH
jgi:hypothetical protein